MKIRLLVCVISLAFMAACSAFDKDPKLYDGFDPSIQPPFMTAGSGQYDGTYKGEMKLAENNCENLADAIDSTTPLKVNVIQSGDVMSVQFDDDGEISGTVKDGKVTILKRDVSNSRIFHLEFTENGVTGECEYIDAAPVGDQLGEPCAKYSLSLSKAE